MSDVDVMVEIDIAAAPSDVAAVMFDPHRAPEWMDAVKTVEVLGPSLEPGAQTNLKGEFLGREIAWTSKVVSVQVPHKLTLEVGDGPFVGTVAYHIERRGEMSHVRMRNSGKTTMMAFLPSAMVEGPMRSVMTADLGRLKALVEKV